MTRHQRTLDAEPQSVVLSAKEQVVIYEARRILLRYLNQNPVLSAWQAVLDYCALTIRGEVERLSRREIECLQWTSEGKTVWECGVILKLSPHTVRCYLESARHKLDASSNTHAVSLALRSGLLFDVR